MVTTVDANTFEATARARKANKLVAEIRRAGITIDDILDNDETRDRLVNQAGIRPPSDTTWAVVLEMLGW